MEPKIAIIDFETKFGSSMKLSLEKRGFQCDQFTDVGRHEPKDGLVKIFTVYSGIMEVRLANYAVVFIGSLRSASASAQAIISTWKELGICCIGSSVVQIQSLLLAGPEFVVDPEQFDRFADLWFPGIYQRACAEHKNRYSN